MHLAGWMWVVPIRTLAPKAVGGLGGREESLGDCRCGREGEHGALACPGDLAEAGSGWVADS